jgi:hypothetical protein
MSSGINGVFDSRVLPTGTRVLVFVPKSTSTGENLSVIIGAAPMSPLFNDDVLKDANNDIFAQVPIIGDLSAEYLYTIADGTPMQYNYLNGAACNVMPDEWSMNNQIGGSLFISQAMAAIKASEMCGLSAFADDDLVRIESLNRQNYTAFGEHIDYLFRAVCNSVKLGWSVLKDGMGELKSSDDLESDVANIYAYEQAEVRPAPDIIEISGALINGTMRQYLATHRYNSADGKVAAGTPVGMVQIREGCDGNYSVKAARSLTLMKTPNIPPIFPLERFDTEPSPNYDDQDIETANIAFLTDEYGFLGAPEVMRNVERERTVTDSKGCFKDAMWDTYYDIDDYREVIGLDYKPELSKLKTSRYTQVDEGLKVEQAGSPSLDGKRRDDVVIGSREAGVRVNDDGSVSIIGGMGEEILMSGGNIYLTAPGDIINLPGRDSLTIAGRNTVTKAIKGVCESEGDSVNTIAHGVMQLVSGTYGRGAMFIHNKANVHSADMTGYKEYEKGATVGGGIVIKTNGMGVVADHLDIGGANYSGSSINIKAQRVDTIAESIIHHIQDGNASAFEVRSNFGMLGLNRSEAIIMASNIGLNGNVRALRRKLSTDIIEVEEKTGIIKDKVRKEIGGSGAISFLIDGNVTTNNIQALAMSNASGSVGKVRDIKKVISEQFNGTKKAPLPPPGATFGYTQPINGFLLSYNAKKTDSSGAEAVDAKDWGAIMPSGLYTPEWSIPKFQWQEMLQKTASWYLTTIGVAGFKSEANKCFPGNNKSYLLSRGNDDKLIKATLNGNYRINV